MRKGKVWIYIWTILLVCTILLVGVIETQKPPFMTAVIGSGEREEELSCWYDTYTGTVYFFLPGYAELDQVRLSTGQDGVYQVGEQWIEDGMHCGAFQLNEPYPISAPEGMLYSGKKLVFVRSEGVSALFLDTRSGDMSYLHEDKNHSEQGTYRMYDTVGQLTHSGTVDSVKGRGQSSWKEEKKSYNIQLKEDANLLGLGSAQNWVLQANSKDATHLRNKMVFDFADAAGLAYTPDSQWVDLYLNGEYAGLYLLCEKIEIHPQRVDISKEGSFLVSKDWEWRFEQENKPFIMTEQNTALEVRDSDLADDALLQKFQSVENAILSEDGVDPVTGKSWQELIDLDSWVRKYLLEEIFGNKDGLTLSQYYYLDGSSADGRICAGPAWDYDLIMQNAYNLYHVNRPGIYGSSWMPALLEKDAFLARLQEIYTEEFRPLLQQLLDAGILEYAEQISSAASMDKIRWYGDVSVGDAETLRTYLQKRVELFDGMWISHAPYVVVDAVLEDGSRNIYILDAGSPLSELGLPESDGCFLKDTQEQLDVQAPLYQDVSVYLAPLSPDAGAQEITAEEHNLSGEETAADEGISLQRSLPAVLFVVVMLCIVTADLWQRFRERIPEQKKLLSSKK